MKTLKMSKERKLILARYKAERNKIEEYEYLIEQSEKEIKKIRAECKHENFSHEFGGCDWYTECGDCGAIL